MNSSLLWLFSVVACVAGCAYPSGRQNVKQADEAETRAVRYLSREVPRWSAENGCFSCHNNGDAARALYVATASHIIPSAALRDTSAWLANPAQWDSNRGDPGFSDKVLARIQFAAALSEALDAGEIGNERARTKEGRPRPHHDVAKGARRSPVRLIAARGLMADQQTDGSWRIEGVETVGSPATYGTALATFMASIVLRGIDDAEIIAARQKAEHWLRHSKPNNIPHAAAVFWSSQFASEAPEVSTELLDYFQRSLGSDGGWGPYPGAPSEAFDTALVLLATAHTEPTSAMKSVLRRGREFLLLNQDADGSWVETTRPANGQSYAQHISTTGWATLALMATRHLAP